MNVNYAKFKKSLMVEQFQGNYLNFVEKYYISLLTKNVQLIG